MAEIWKFLRKRSMMESLSVNLQAYSVQTGFLVQKKSIIDSFRNMYRKLAVLKRIF